MSVEGIASSFWSTNAVYKNLYYKDAWQSPWETVSISQLEGVQQFIGKKYRN